MEDLANKLVNKQMKYYGFTLEFSKVLSYVYTSTYVITLIMCWITDLLLIPTNLHSLLDFVLNPTLIVVGFYFSSKTIEKVSLNVANVMAKKLELRQLAESDTSYEDTYYNTTTSVIPHNYSSGVIRDEDQRGEI